MVNVEKVADTMVNHHIRTPMTVSPNVRHKILYTTAVVDAEQRPPKHDKKQMVSNTRAHAHISVQMRVIGNCLPRR